MLKFQNYTKGLVSICLLIPFFITAQNISYFDSLNSLIPSLNKKAQIDLTLAIPFDRMNSNTVAAIKLYEQALQLKTADSINAQVNEKLALAYYYKGDYDLSVEKSLIAIKLYEKIKNELKIGNVYANLGYQMKRRDLTKAFEYMQKGIGILQKRKNKEALSGAYNNYGVLFEMDNKLDSALYYYQEGLTLIESLNDSIGIPYSLNNIAGTYVLKNEYDLAKSYYDKAFYIRKKRNDINGLAENYTYYGDLYFKQALYKKAISYYTKAKRLCDEINYTYLQKVNSEQLSSCYEELKIYDKALIYKKEAATLNDSLLNESSNKTIVQLETQFETEKKEKQIVEQKVKLAQQELQVKKQNYFIYAIIGIVSIIIVLAFFILKQIRFKQQKLIAENQLKDKIITIKLKGKLNEERVRISRDLHDNIGSQLTFIISSIDNMSYFMKETNNDLKIRLTALNEFSRSAITELRTTINTLNKKG